MLRLDCRVVDCVTRGKMEQWCCNSSPSWRPGHVRWGILFMNDQSFVVSLEAVSSCVQLVFLFWTWSLFAVGAFSNLIHMERNKSRWNWICLVAARLEINNKSCVSRSAALFSTEQIDILNSAFETIIMNISECVHMVNFRVDVLHVLMIIQQECFIDVRLSPPDSILPKPISLSVRVTIWSLFAHREGGRCAEMAMVCLTDFEEYAKEHLSKATWDYYAAGADECCTRDDNLLAYKRYSGEHNIYRDIQGHHEHNNSGVSLLFKYLKAPCLTVTSSKWAAPDVQALYNMCCEAEQCEPTWAQITILKWWT